MSFPEALKTERTRLGINQTECSKLLSVSFEAVSKWERGISTPCEIAQEGALARLSKAVIQGAQCVPAPVPEPETKTSRLARATAAQAQATGEPTKERSTESTEAVPTQYITVCGERADGTLKHGLCHHPLSPSHYLLRSTAGNRYPICCECAGGA